MRIVIPNIGEVKKLKCDECDVKFTFNCNEFDYEEYNLHEFTDNAWFDCPHCKKCFLVEDYTENGILKSIKLWLGDHDNFINRLSKNQRIKIGRAKDLLNAKGEEDGK